MKIRAILTGLVVATACGSSTAPLTGDIYVLQSIAGDPLPAPYAVNQVSDHRIIADTLAFVAGGAGVRRTVYDDDLVEGGSYLSELAFVWTQTGDRISISYPCRDTGDCIAGPHLAGTKGTSSLTIDHSLISAQPLVFAKVERLE